MEWCGCDVTDKILPYKLLKFLEWNCAALSGTMISGRPWIVNSCCKTQITVCEVIDAVEKNLHPLWKRFNDNKEHLALERASKTFVCLNPWCPGHFPQMDWRLKWYKACMLVLFPPLYCLLDASIYLWLLDVISGKHFHANNPQMPHIENIRNLCSTCIGKVIQ